MKALGKWLLIILKKLLVLMAEAGEVLTIGRTNYESKR
jgi:hypothetical protein